MSLDAELAIAFTVFWLQLYSHAARHREEPFWKGFLDPFGLNP